MAQVKKEFFNLQNDIYLCFAYCVPASSKVLQRDFMPDDVYDSLDGQLAEYSAPGELILMTDANARTLTGLDYIENEDNTHIPIPSPDIYEVDPIATYPRNNLDMGTNSYGERFLETCRKVPLRMCNGRKVGDLIGNFTCYHRNTGQSTVDYCAVSPELFQKVLFFLVSLVLPVCSDNTPISITLNLTRLSGLKLLLVSSNF